jgi:uncharacterized protein
MLKTQDNRAEFKLRLAGVANGKHSFSIICDKSFFDSNELSDILDGSVNLQILMDKSDKMLKIDFHFKGELIAECARCLDPVSYPVHFESSLLVNLVQQVEEGFENDDDIWMIQEKEYELDVYQYVYETIVLSLPSQIIHPDDDNGDSTCNHEFLKTLAAYTVDETALKQKEIDPRWDALKNIKLDD